MVVRPWIMSYSAIDFFIRIARPLCTELPDGPVVSVFGVEEFDEVFEGVAIGELGICARGTGCRDDVVRDIAQIETRFVVARSWRRYDLAENIHGMAYGGA